MPKWIGNRFGSIVPITPGAAAPSAIYNLFDQYYSRVDGGWLGPQAGLTATGGVVSDYTTPPGAVYRAHVFTASGTFDVSAGGDFGDTVEYLVVAGGGGGGAVIASPGYAGAGGGGGGGVKTNLAPYPNVGSSFPVSTSPGSYTVTIGGGGVGGNTNGQGAANGTDSVFGSITATGGGAGGDTTSVPQSTSEGGSSGGSGGGSSGRLDSPPGIGAASPNSDPDRQGYPGGDNSTNSGGAAGGGGATEAGSARKSSGVGGDGGDGITSVIQYGPGTTASYAGGGGGGSYTDVGPWTTPSGGTGGGGAGGAYASPRAGGHATPSTGGGGGGGTGGTSVTSDGGNGASGIVLVRYQIGELVASAKATGGNVTAFAPDSPSPMAGYTVHTFTSSGTFTNTSGSTIPGALYLVVGGGGSGAGPNLGADGAAGGGAGGLISNHPEVPAPKRGGALTLPTAAVTVTIGAGGSPARYPAGQGSPGFISSFGPTLIASGGGGGRLGASVNGNAGGSGGGSSGGGSAGNGGAGNTWTPDAPGHPGSAPNQGNAGGKGNDPPTSNFGSGGGGGFTAAGSGGGPGDGGPGGAGINLTITGYSSGYAGGGGGGAAGPYRGTYDKGGATHGGGEGANADTSAPTYNAVSGDMGTGGGGGGGGGSHGTIGFPISGTTSGGGGSGIVVVAYPS